jgi:hypothetical protein
VILAAFLVIHDKGPTKDSGLAALQQPPVLNSTKKQSEANTSPAEIPTTPRTASRASVANRNITEAQNAIIHKALDSAFEELKDVERKNKSTAYDRVFPRSRVMMVRVDRPSQSQLDSIRRHITEALSQLPPDSPAWKQMSAKGEKFIEENVAYPKANKLVRVTALHDGSAYSLDEIYVDDPDVVLPNDAGTSMMPLPPLGYTREDPDFGGPKSWGAKRYAHLFSIEEIKGGGGQAPP